MQATEPRGVLSLPTGPSLQGGNEGPRSGVGIRTEHPAALPPAPAPKHRERPQWRCPWELSAHPGFVGLEEGEGGEGDPSVGPSLRQRGRAHHLGPCTVQSPSPKAGTMEVDSHSGQCKGAVPWWGLDSGALGMFGGVRGRVGGSESAEERGRQGLGAKRSPPGLLHPERKTKPWVKGKTCRGGSRHKWQEASAG